MAIPETIQMRAIENIKSGMSVSDAVEAAFLEEINMIGKVLGDRRLFNAVADGMANKVYEAIKSAQ